MVCNRCMRVAGTGINNKPFSVSLGEVVLEDPLTEKKSCNSAKAWVGQVLNCWTAIAKAVEK